METLAIAGVVLIPLIIGIIQAAKRADVDNTVPKHVWFYSAVVLGVVGSAVAFLIADGVPTTLGSWAAMLVLGINFGLAAGKVYDETLLKRKMHRRKWPD